MCGGGGGGGGGGFGNQGIAKIWRKLVVRTI